MTGIQEEYFQYLIVESKYTPPTPYKDSGWVVYVERHAENSVLFEQLN